MIDRPPCPICGAPRCILVHPRKGAPPIGQTCGSRNCAAKLRAQRLGPDHYRKLVALMASKRKPKQWSHAYERGYHAGLATGHRKGFAKGYEAARAAVSGEVDVPR